MLKRYVCTCVYVCVGICVYACKCKCTCESCCIVQVLAFGFKLSDISMQLYALYMHSRTCQIIHESMYKLHMYSASACACEVVRTQIDELSMILQLCPPHDIRVDHIFFESIHPF